MNNATLAMFFGGAFIIGSDKSRLYLAKLAALIGKNPEDVVARLDAISVFRRKSLWGGILKKVL